MAQLDVLIWFTSFRHVAVVSRSFRLVLVWYQLHTILHTNAPIRSCKHHCNNKMSNFRLNIGSLIGKYFNFQRFGLIPRFTTIFFLRATKNVLIFKT